MVSIQKDDRQSSVILVADDSEADRDIIQRAIEDSGVNCIFKEVKDGELLLKYLQEYIMLILFFQEYFIREL